jgi:hypothetical protein
VRVDVSAGANESELPWPYLLRARIAPGSRHGAPSHAAEQLAVGRITIGAADDVAKATEIARDVVTQYGMEAALGPMSTTSGGKGFLCLPPGRAGTLTGSRQPSRTGWCRSCGWWPAEATNASLTWGC